MSGDSADSDALHVEEMLEECQSTKLPSVKKNKSGKIVLMIMIQTSVQEMLKPKIYVWGLSVSKFLSTVL